MASVVEGEMKFGLPVSTAGGRAWCAMNFPSRTGSLGGQAYSMPKRLENNAAADSGHSSPQYSGDSSTLMSPNPDVSDRNTDEDEFSGSDSASSVEETFDDFGELTSLAWLQDANLLRNIGGTRSSQALSRGLSNEVGPHGASYVFADEARFGAAAADRRMSCPASTADSAVRKSSGGYREEGYRSSRPPYSLSCLIFMAIEQSPGKCLPVKGIYEWIAGCFPYYRLDTSGWKNSVRHNLSSNKCFSKVDRDENANMSAGKGARWQVDPEHRPNLLQALRRTPYHPHHQLQLTSLIGTLNKIKSESQEACANSCASQSPSIDMEAASALVSLRTPSLMTQDSICIKIESLTSPMSPAPAEVAVKVEPSRKRKRCESEQHQHAVFTRPVTVTSIPSLDHTYIMHSDLGLSRAQPGSAYESSSDEEQEQGTFVRRRGDVSSPRSRKASAIGLANEGAVGGGRCQQRLGSRVKKSGGGDRSLLNLASVASLAMMDVN